MLFKLEINKYKILTKKETLTNCSPWFTLYKSLIW